MGARGQITIVGTLASGVLRRRRLQGAIIAAVLLLATLATTVALDILVASRSPFETAFTAANGAHLVATFQGDGVTDAELATTTTAPGVTAASGPWPIAQAGFLVNPADAAKGLPAGYVPGSISGRPAPDSTVDRLTLVQGHWWQQPGDIVLSRAQAGLAAAAGEQVGDSIVLAELGGAATGGIVTHGQPTTETFRIVGVAVSISSPDIRAWLSPTDLAAFVPAGQSVERQMLYRVSNPDDQGSLAAAQHAIAALVPQGALATASTWLGLQTGASTTANLMVPILLAFAAFAFLAAAFIIVNVVTGVVLGNLRHIGLLKSIGATPGQVAATLVVQVVVPAVVGAVAGTAVGALASQPILGQSAAALGVTAVAQLSPAVLTLVPLTAILVTLVAALGPALRGGHLRAADVLTRGSTPAGARSGRARQIAFRAPEWLPDSARLGLRRLSARPLRSAMTFGALVVGVSALSFTLGMEGSLRNVAVALFRTHASPVRIEIPAAGSFGSIKPGGPAGQLPMTSPQVQAVIDGQPGTARSVAIGEADVALPGYPGLVPLFAYRGDTSWLGYTLTEGRWFAGPGEVVVPDNFLTQTGLRVGDHVTAIVNGDAVPLTIVGSIFDNGRCRCEGPRNVVMRGDWSTIATADPGLEPTSWEVVPNDLISPSGLASQIRQATNGYADARVAQNSDTDEGFLFFEGVIGSLGVILVLVALGGVANTVLLESRERMRETAILRAVGMAPRQVVTMVVASVLPLGLVAALFGAPIGAMLMRAVIVNMGQIAIASSVPTSLTASIGPPELALILVGAVAIGVAGSWLPARQTARSPIAPVLQAE
jgi:putative ABC transport system permease protein